MKNRTKLLVLFVVIFGAGLLYYSHTNKAINVKKRETKKEILYKLPSNVEEASEIYSDEFIVKAGDKYGILDKNLKEIKGMNYDFITRLSGDVYYLQTTTENTLFNSKNKKELKVESLAVLNGDFYKVKIGNYYGIVDKNLDTLIEAKYLHIDSNEDYAIGYTQTTSEVYKYPKLTKVKLDNKLGLMKIGVGEYLYNFKDGKSGIVDAKGKEVVKAEYDSFLALNHKDIVVGSKGKDKYFINLSKGIEEKVEYENFGEESQELIMVLKDSKIGYINSEGKEVIPAIYDGGFKAKEDKDFYQVKSGNKWLLLDKNGKKYKELDYDDIGEYVDGVMLVLKDGKFGYIDKTGKEVIPLDYTYGEDFKDDVAIVGKDSGFGVINKKNEIVIPFIYDDIKIIGEYVYVLQDNKYGILDEKGEEILPVIYDGIGRVKDGIVFAKKDGKVGYLKIGGGNKWK